MPEKNSQLAPEVPAPYENPKYNRGLLRLVPKAWVPYGELMRLELPHGLYLCYFPLFVGILHGSVISPVPVKPSEIAYQATLYLGWNFFLRGAGCAWNDNVDQEFDRQTGRCKTRPIARGAVSTTGANLFTMLFVALAFACIWPLPAICIKLGVLTTGLSLVYPYCKRYTYFASVILGITIAVSFILATYGTGLESIEEKHRAPTIYATVAIVLLIIFYDVVYARPDIVDDLKSGVKGMAVLFRNYIEVLLSILTLAAAGLLALTGRELGTGPYFYLFAVGGLTATYFFIIIQLHRRVFETWTTSSGWLYVFAVINLAAGYLTEYLR
ncbi:hypothetical protein S40285_06629 [Stachybotrys chlorohalonatus IBT 40285]|uniref:Uncharacterized protein n=1 Tax=Stachybotrys chlorohalonatus (strain IBT 40285) TaxID=1283841 RepID=A0A084R1P3_STAC4|nr:hypothetical protein S40285_06629 [Stachybotrys chlorohalonata IBT 40285]